MENNITISAPAKSWAFLKEVFEAGFRSQSHLIHRDVRPQMAALMEQIVRACNTFAPPRIEVLREMYPTVEFVAQPGADGETVPTKPEVIH